MYIIKLIKYSEKKLPSTLAWLNHSTTMLPENTVVNKRPITTDSCDFVPEEKKKKAD